MYCHPTKRNGDESPRVETLNYDNIGFENKMSSSAFAASRPGEAVLTPRSLRDQHSQCDAVLMLAKPGSSDCMTAVQRLEIMNGPMHFCGAPREPRVCVSATERQARGGGSFHGSSRCSGANAQFQTARNMPVYLCAEEALQNVCCGDRIGTNAVLR